jgi:hypothetical protein
MGILTTGILMGSLAIIILVSYRLLPKTQRTKIYDFIQGIEGK